MNRHLDSINPVFAGMFLTLLLVLFSTGFVNAQVVIKTTNDVGITTTSSSFSTTNEVPCVITNIFDDGSLPEPKGITGTSSGTQDGRLFRDGSPSTCISCSGFSTYDVGQTRKYEYYTFTARTTGCLNIVAEMPVGNADLYLAVYTGSYNPADYTANGIGQGGLSGTTSFACPVIAGQTYVLVVMDVFGSGEGTSYTISLDNVAGSIVPVSIWWILTAFVLIGGFTLYKFRIKRV